MKITKVIPLILLVAIVGYALVRYMAYQDPHYGEPISMEMGQTVQVTDGSHSVSITYVGIDEYANNVWQCSFDGQHDCAQRSSLDQGNVQLFHVGQRIGKTDGNLLQLTGGWEVLQP